MTVEELNELVSNAYNAAFAHEAKLTAIYMRAFARAGKHAVSTFNAQVVTAAAFVPPDTQTLATGLSEQDQQQAAKVRQDAADAIAFALIALGLSSIATSLLAAVAQRGAQNFDDEVLRVLRSVLEQADAGAWSADETAQAIKKAFDGISETTAQMMAQTELTTMVNERSLQAAQSVAQSHPQPIYKIWETMQDPRVRPAHAAVQSQTVPVSQPFQVGGYEMMYPGDTSAPMRLVARCRCQMTYTQSLTASAKEDNVMPMESLTASTIVVITDDDDCDVQTGDGTDTPAVDDAPMQDGAPFRVLLAVENQPTEDGRVLMPNSVVWRDLPLSLMAMDETGPGGHEGAKVAGRIDSIERDGYEIWGQGFFNGNEFGKHIEDMVGNQSLRGNSVDLAVTSFEYRNADGEPMDMEAAMVATLSGEPVVFAVLEGTIMASTVCPTPAIGDASIMLASGMLVLRISAEQTLAPPGTVVLTAAAAGLAPLAPPLAWFDEPQLDGPTPLTVTPEGQVYGHAALWNSCHIAEPYGPGICVPPPRSGMSYEIFHHGVVTTAEGVDVPCGQITMSAPHASRELGWKGALAHYENSAVCAADVVAGEDAWGIWVTGGLRPGLSAEKVREMKGGSLSGDWREVIGRGLEFLGALVVNIPGFPIPRPEARVVASAAGEEQVLALVAAGIVTDEDVQQMTRQEYLRKIEGLTRIEYADGFDISQADRDKAAKSGAALPDGSYPITKCTGDGPSAENAIRSQGRAPDQGKVVAHIKKRVAALGCTGDIFKKYQ